MPAKLNLTGQKFNKLLVLNESEKRIGGRVTWVCQCDCGNIVLVTAKNLTNNNTKSCGCLKKKDLIGKKFGKLTVIDYTNKVSSGGSAIWKCQCDCGNQYIATTNHLITGNTQSCGCLQGQSLGELQIKTLLEQNNIKYKSEYIFSELPNRRYDFALLNNNNEVIQLIEFDGEQHYQEVPFFKTSLQEQKNIDEEKNIFAKNKNIKLVRIPYYKRNNLTFKDLEVDIYD